MDSSAEIADNRAYGGGILREKTWNAGIDFTGSNSAATLSAGIDFSNGLGFDLTGAVVDANNQIVLGEDATGIAITTQGLSAGATYEDCFAYMISDKPKANYHIGLRLRKAC